MPERIELPQKPSGDELQQLQQMYSYLYQMAETMNSNLAQIGGNELTDAEMAIMRDVISEPAAGTDGMQQIAAEAETLKSMIIKTAEFVRTEINEYNIRLMGSVTAEGQLGKYVRKTNLDVDINPEGIRQNFTFAEIIRGLRTYEINSKNYIYSGLLRTVNQVPVYGVAVGKDIVTFTQDGEEVYTDSNKVAEFTADALTFYQNNAVVAKYTSSGIELYGAGNKAIGITSNRISFYNKVGSTDTEIMYITGGQIYAAKDMSINSGAGLLIESGGKLDVKSGGDLNVKSGGDLYIDSGGKIDIKSGGNLNIKSGGDLTIEGGGDLLVNSSGKIKINSGGTLDVNTNNFVLDSANKKMSAGNWTFNQYGVNCYVSAGHQLMWGVSGTEIVMSLNQGSAGAPEADAQMRLGLTTPQYDSGVSNQPCLHFGKGGFWGIIGGTTYALQEIYARRSCYWTLQQQSSRQVKDHIEELPEMGDVIDRLKPVSYQYRQMPGEKRFGLIWEDTIDVLPEICAGNPLGDPGQRAINYLELVGILLKEIQSLRQRVAALENG